MSARRRRPVSSGRRIAVIGTGLVVLLGGAAVYVAVDGDAPSTSGAGSKALPAGEFPEPGVVHVHGLGVDPGDGTLYAATHSGLFVLPQQGKAARVANRYQDTMGFTVTGPRTFLGSGHPDLREDHPPRLGLIESTDAGLSWTALSLRGDADFHALHAAHGRVYGYDATSATLMVSPDRRTWDRRSRLSIRDFAVSPTSADTLLATTERGLQRSTDGGATWTGRGGVGGAPEAMTADVRGAVETVYVAVAGRGILASTDGGRTFTTRYAE